MILVDTSVWIDFFRGVDRAAGLESLLEDDQVALHPWVLGELAMGNIGSSRSRILSDLGRVPAIPLVPDEEVLEFVESRLLYGRGIGWVDAHLLGAALVSDTKIWTFDRPLATAAEELGVLEDRSRGQT